MTRLAFLPRPAYAIPRHKNGCCWCSWWKPMCLFVEDQGGLEKWGITERDSSEQPKWEEKKTLDNKLFEQRRISIKNTTVHFTITRQSNRDLPPLDSHIINNQRGSLLASLRKKPCVALCCGSLGCWHAQEHHWTAALLGEADSSLSSRDWNGAGYKTQMSADHRVQVGPVPYTRSLGNGIWDHFNCNVTFSRDLLYWHLYWI